MKKLVSLSIAALLSLAAFATETVNQDTLYVMNQGALVSKRAVSDIDSMTFSVPEGTMIEEESAPKAKYIFLFIGDGMASPQINMAELASAVNGYRNDSDTAGIIGQLNMTSFPIVGMQRTHATNRYITGSAASATALATGYKTSINTISQSSDNTENYKTIAELAKEEGMKVGIVSSVSIDHATPACFYAHSLTRNYYNFIASQMSTSNFDYFGGGWAKGYDPKYQDASRNPEGHIAVTDESAGMPGWSIATTRNDFDALNSTPAWAYTSMGDGSGSLPYIMDIDQDDNGADITLSEFTQKGIELMQDSENGFFMMIEGGKIDWACHANDVVSATSNTIEFDNAIGKAVEFMNAHPDSTLIVVTGDHETGGLTIGYAATGYESALEILNNQTESYEVFDDRMKEWESSDISEAMTAMNEVFGLGDDSNAKDPALVLTANEQMELAEAFYKSCSNPQSYESAGNTEEYLKSGGYNAFTMAITHIQNRKAGIAWTSYSHTAVPVPVLAKGAGAELFSGYYENTKVPCLIKEAAQFTGEFPAVLD